MVDALQLQYWIEQAALFDNEEAYEKVFLHFNNNLYRLAFSFVRDEQVAEEIISDTFINLWKNRVKLLEIENLKVYLYISVKNLCIRHLSRNKSRIDFGFDDVFLEHAASTSHTPESLMVSEEMLKSLERAIENLPPKCRLIFKMVREDGLKYKEIAQILNISVKTIDAQMAIATKRVVQSLGCLIRE